MGIYDHRNGPAYREPVGRPDPLIAKWWTPAHDSLIAQMIRADPRLWYWRTPKDIPKMTDPVVLAAWKHEHSKAPGNIWYNAIMYHAVHRAKELGLGVDNKDNSVPTKQCALCQQVFTEDSIPVPFVDRMGSARINFCAPCLNSTIGQKSGRRDWSRTEILEYLRRLADALGRIPSQGFEESAATFQKLSDDERLRLLRALQGKPTAEAVLAEFGTWFHALCEAGLLPGGTRRLAMGTQCTANDGHVCLSLAEKTIDDILYAHDIQHEKEPRYPEGSYRADFRVGNLFIEYFGLVGDPEYDAAIQRKRDIVSRHHIPLLELYPDDMASYQSLTAKLTHAASLPGAAGRTL
jgi:hypothetical protein